MNTLSGFLPFAVLLILVLYFAFDTISEKTPGAWRIGAVRAVLFWFAFIWVVTETFSVFNWLVKPVALAAWLILAGAVITHALVSGKARVGWEQLRRCWAQRKGLPVEGYLLAAVLMITFAVALVSPPNNNDSISYHIPRVMHWIQNRSVDFYPTVIERQLFMPPLAEYGLLHMVILGGSDGSLGLLQWICFAGVVIAVSQASCWLGAGKQGQWLAGIFAATLPMAVLQSTSTQNDLVAAFFAAALLERILSVLTQQKLNAESIVWISLAAALGMYTKGTFVTFCIPWLVLVGLVVLRREGFLKALILTAFVAAATFIVNAPLWARNILVFNNFLGPEAYLTSQQGLFIHPLEAVSNILKNFSFHISTPFGEVNLLLKGVYVKLHELIGVDLNATSLHQGDTRFSLSAFSLHEDLAGNPVHFLLIGITVVWMILGGWKRLTASQRQYALTWVLTWIFFCILFPWQPWGSRLQLSLFVLGAPLASFMIVSISPRKLAAAASVILALISIPWLLFNNTRPVVGSAWDKVGQSVFSGDEKKTLFANRSGALPHFIWLQEEVDALDCRVLGMEINSGSPEYFFWWSTFAPFNDRSLIHIHPETYPAVPDDILDQVCADICMICDEDEDTRNGMPLAGTSGWIRIYADPQSVE